MTRARVEDRGWVWGPNVLLPHGRSRRGHWACHGSGLSGLLWEGGFSQLSRPSTWQCFSTGTCCTDWVVSPLGRSCCESRCRWPAAVLWNGLVPLVHLSVRRVCWAPLCGRLCSEHWGYAVPRLTGCCSLGLCVLVSSSLPGMRRFAFLFPFAPDTNNEKFTLLLFPL